MEIPLNVLVDCVDGRCGRSTYVVADPISQQMTHLVVRDEHRPHTERLVPAALIADSNHEGIKLSCTKQEWQMLEPFYTTEFIEADIPFVENWGSSYLWPYVTTVTKPEYIRETAQHLPLHTHDVRRGAVVQATDGRVGRVDEFVVDPQSHRITHLVMREGHLWGTKTVSIPIEQIDELEEKMVYLKLDKAGVEKLPTVVLHHAQLDHA